MRVRRQARGQIFFQPVHLRREATDLLVEVGDFLLLGALGLGVRVLALEDGGVLFSHGRWCPPYSSPFCCPNLWDHYSTLRADNLRR